MYLSTSSLWGLISPSIVNESYVCQECSALNAHLICVGGVQKVTLISLITNNKTTSLIGR